MTTPSTPRKAGPLNGTGAQTAWPFTFKVFAKADVLVTVADSDGVETVLVLDSDYSVSLNANQETSPGGTVTYPISGTALPVGSKLSITGALDYDQPLDIPTGGNFSPVALENQLDRIVMQVQQLAEEASRSAKLPVTNAGDATALVADIVRLADSAANIDTLASNIAAVTTVASDLNEPVSEINAVAGAIANVDTVGANIANVNTVAGISANVTAVAGNAANINAVAGNATNINAVNTNAANIDAVAGNATNINTVATNIAAVNTTATNMAAVIAAPSEAAAAAASAAAAAASAASGMYSAVQDKSADYTVLAADAGDLIRVTTTGGARTITLPAISGVPDGFNVTVVKWTGDANSVTVARSGTDTINGSATYVLDAQYKSATFVADAQTATWFASGSGGAGSNVVVDTFAGTGAQTAFTLSGDPGSENNTQVFVSGVYQNKDQYSLSGATLTFSAAPPLGTSNIEVVWTQPLAIGVPADGTVTAAKMAAGAAVANIGYTPVNKTGDTMTGALLLAGDPSVELQAAPKQYVDNAVPTVRQTVLSGPVDSSGLPAFGGSTGSTTVTTSGTLKVAVANGTENRLGSITNASWTGLSTNGTMYLYLTVAADGTCTTGSTTLAPVYQWGGTYSVTNNQHTFNIQEMVMKVGNGSTASQTYRVFVGEVTVAGSVVTAITWYALMGRYWNKDAGIPSTTRISKNHNIGVTPMRVRVMLQCQSADLNYSAGEEVDILAMSTSGGTTPPAFSATPLTMGIIYNTNAWYLLNKTTGSLTAATTGNWDTVFYADRGW